jgi:hypothetical protein
VRTAQNCELGATPPAAAAKETRRGPLAGIDGVCLPSGCCAAPIDLPIDPADSPNPLELTVLLGDVGVKIVFRIEASRTREQANCSAVARRGHLGEAA